MVYQRNVNKVRQDVWMDWITAAKLHTVIKGKTMPALEFKDRKPRKETRQMSVGCFIEQMVVERLKDVKPDADALKWIAERRKKAIAMREKQDEKVRNGANRKPKSEWKKRGRVAGKVYPKYEEAMKRVAAEKRRAAELRRAKRNSQSKK